MKTTKRILAVVLCFVMVFAACAVGAYAQDEETETVCVHTDYEWVTTLEATASEEGEMQKQCLTCKEMFGDPEVIEAGGCNHPYYTWTTTKNATCEVTGIKTKICNICSAPLGTETIETHNFVAINKTDATCTSEGSIFWFCLSCYLYYTEILPIDSDNHYFSDWSVTKEATCVEEGEKQRECYRCLAVEKEAVECDTTAHTHDENTVFTRVVEPDCETAGLESYTCTTCLETVTREVPRHSNTLEEIEGTREEPLCNKEGTIHLKCSKCGYLTTEKIPVDAENGHSYTGSWVIIENATESAHGTKKQKCVYCGNVDESEDAEVAIHNFTEVVGIPSCGKTEMQCSVDGCTETEIYDTVGTHSDLYWYASDGKSKVDCSVASLVYQYCDACDAAHSTILASKTVAVGTHPNVQDYTILTAAGCTTMGIVKGYCPDCDKENVTAYTSKLGHIDPDYYCVVKSATCLPLDFDEATDDEANYSGLIEKYCDRCGETIDSQVVEPYSHNYAIVKEGTPATCTSDGITDYKYCTICGIYVPQQKIEAYGHNFVDQIVDGSVAVKICDRCYEYQIIGDDGSEVTCSCICHNSNGIGKMVFGLLNFFYRLFGINQVCDCGTLHYEETILGGLFGSAE